MISNPVGIGARPGGLRRALGWLAVLGLLMPLVAAATHLSEPDARAVREVVQAQLDAFTADDADSANSLI